jgi:hypothetical protein
MTFSIQRSTHARDEDKFVRLVTDRGVVTVSMMEWTYALGHAGQCSPSGEPIGSPPGGTPAAEERPGAERLAA